MTDNAATARNDGMAKTGQEQEARGRSLALACACAHAADAKKATDVLVFDLAGLSDVCDAIVVCTGANPRLIDSVVDEVEERVRGQFGLSPLSVEGRDACRWVLVDYGAVVLHAFSPEGREFYRLERLWGDAPRVDAGLELS